MADHEFFGTLSVSEPATAGDHVTRKTELDAAVATLQAVLGGKAPTSHAHATGDITGLAAYIDGRVEAIVDADGAVAALNTLPELAAALGNASNFSATVTGLISAIDTRVDALEAAAGTAAYKTTVGDGAASSFTVTHGRSTLDVAVEVVRVSDGQTVYPVVKRTSTNACTVDFGSVVPAAGADRIIVQAA